MDKACSRNGEETNAYRIMVRKTGGRRPLEDQDVDRRIRNKNNTHTHTHIYAGTYKLQILIFINNYNNIYIII
jgi:hypothetical protein